MNDELGKDELLNWIDDFRHAWSFYPKAHAYKAGLVEQAYKQIRELIQKPGVTEEFIEEKATELYNYLYYETFSLDQVKDFIRLLCFEEYDNKHRILK